MAKAKLETFDLTISLDKLKHTEENCCMQKEANTAARFSTLIREFLTQTPESESNFKCMINNSFQKFFPDILNFKQPTRVVLHDLFYL